MYLAILDLGVHSVDWAQIYIVHSVDVWWCSKYLIYNSKTLKFLKIGQNCSRIVIGGLHKANRNKLENFVLLIIFYAYLRCVRPLIIFWTKYALCTFTTNYFKNNALCTPFEWYNMLSNTLKIHQMPRRGVVVIRWRNAARVAKYMRKGRYRFFCAAFMGANYV